MGVKSFVCPRQGVVKSVRPFRGGVCTPKSSKRPFKKLKMDDSALETIYIVNQEGKKLNYMGSNPSCAHTRG
jgi:hypothetical protein